MPARHVDHVLRNQAGISHCIDASNIANNWPFASSQRIIGYSALNMNVAASKFLVSDDHLSLAFCTFTGTLSLLFDTERST
jgi:hypothetical protein